MKTAILKAIALAGILGFSVSANAAPVQWAGNGHWYEIQDNATWNDAEANAQSVYGGHLVTINDSAEQAWLVSEFGTARFWIGLNDIVTEGTWAWASGEAVAYTNWAANEPNNSGNEDYVAMNWIGTGWNDWKGNNRILSIVEFTRTNDVPEPATMGLLGLGLIGMGLIRRRKTA